MPFDRLLILIALAIIAGGSALWLAMAIGARAALVTMLPVATGLSVWLHRAIGRRGVR